MCFLCVLCASVVTPFPSHFLRAFRVPPGRYSRFNLHFTRRTATMQRAMESTYPGMGLEQGGGFTVQTQVRIPVVAPQATEGETPPAPPVLPRIGGILRRRWRLLVVLPLLALIIAGVNYAVAPRTYMATGSVTVTDQSPPAQDPQYAEYYRNLSSEAATDDLTKIVLGSTFIHDVTVQLQATGTPIPEKDVKEAITTTRVFRVLTVGATTNNYDRAMAITRAALDTLVAKAPSYFPNRPVMVSVVNVPTDATKSTLKAQILAVGTVLAALIAAVALALLAELLDPRLHTRRDVEDVLGIPVVGAIPGAVRGKAA